MDLFKGKTVIVSGGAEGIGFAVAQAVGREGMNVVITEHGGLIEVQGTAEGATFNRDELSELLALASDASEVITAAQRAALSEG